MFCFSLSIKFEHSGTSNSILTRQYYQDACEEEAQRWAHHYSSQRSHFSNCNVPPGSLLHTLFQGFVESRVNPPHRSQCRRSGNSELWV
jgi:hypothetical protein